MECDVGWATLAMSGGGLCYRAGDEMWGRILMAEDASRRKPRVELLLVV